MNVRGLIGTCIGSIIGADLKGLVKCSRMGCAGALLKGRPMLERKLETLLGTGAAGSDTKLVSCLARCVLFKVNVAMSLGSVRTRHKEGL